VKRILNATRRLTQGDFTARIEPLHGFDRMNEFDAIIGNLNTMAEELGGIETLRTDFIANVSHELKTPLAIIKGYCEALKDNVREDKKEHYLAQTIQQADMMSKLVEDMLDLSRMESGHYKPQLINFDITMLTKNILESLRLLADEKNLHISLVSSVPAISIQADRMKIGQVIGNFIHNAIRHTPVDGHIFIRINAMDTSVRFEVENEGANIAPNEISKVWARFYREEKARGKKTGGTGLGLALSEKILQAHRMGYGVENTQAGVMFYFTYRR
jgi:signal transduction histidine kinase